MARPRRTWFGLLALVGLALLTAGCFGGAGDEESLDSTDAEPSALDEELEDADNQTSLVFEGPTVSTTIVEEGSFGAADGAFVGGNLRGADTHAYDLTPEVPDNVPVTVNVTITYSGETSQLNGELVVEGAELFHEHYFKAIDSNTIWMEATLARLGSGDVTAIVQADSAGESAERAYTLEARIDGYGASLVPGVPTSIPVTADSGGFALEAEQDPTGLADATVWGPDGTLVEQAEASGDRLELAVEGEKASGRYVALVPAGEGPTGEQAATFSVEPVNASQAPAEVLEVVGLTEPELGSWQDVAPGEEATWSFERAKAPARAGIVLRSTGVVGTGSISVQLDSPAGTVLEGSTTTIAVGGGQMQWLSPVADETLVSGTYEGSASLTADSTAYEATHIVQDLDR